MDEITKLAGAIARHTPPDGICATLIPGLLLARQPRPTKPIDLVVDPSLCIIAQGAKEICLADEVYRYDAARMLIVSIDLPISARVVEASPTRPCLAARLSFDPALLGEVLSECPDPTRAEGASRGLDVSPSDPRLLDAVARLIDLLDSPRDVQALSTLILREITYRVLTGPQGSRLRQIVGHNEAPVQRVAGAIRWLRSHFSDPLHVESLAKRTNMSVSGFHMRFKAVTGLSPVQYQKRLRLHEARRLMLGEGVDAAVAAFRVGYESPSQFSREYRRMFGAPPRRDVAARQSESRAGSAV